MTGMDESLRPQKSRITIFDEPVICQFCAQDVFIPYEVYVDVEQPGIGVRHVRYIAICQHCGHAKHFGDPSRFEKDTYVWALNQYLLSVRKYQIKILLYVGRRNQDKITTFINELIKTFSIEVERMSDLDGEVELQIKLANINDIQIIRFIIMDSARRLKISIKDLTIK